MITMKKLLTLVLTVALCLPLFMSYGVEVNAASGASGVKLVRSVSGNGIPTSKPEKKKETAEKKAQALAKAIEETVKAEESMPVESFTSTESINALPTEVKETSDAGAVYNLSKITTTQGFIAAVEKMVEANKNTATNTGTNVVTFYSSKPITFNAKSLNALSDTATEFVYMFNHEGHLYKVTIPAGAKIDLEGQMFAGPLYIGAKLGTSVLVK